MKKFFLRSLVVMSFVLVVSTSCSNGPDDVSQEIITAPAGKISATIMGTAFEADGGAQISNNEIIIDGTQGNESISIAITNSATDGSFDVLGVPVGIIPGAEINYINKYDDGAFFYTSVFTLNGTVVGTVTITEIDEANKTISGTFSSKIALQYGTTMEDIAGSFNKLPYVNFPANTLTAKIDGQEFTTAVAAGRRVMEIELNGQASDGSKIITISFPDNIAVGTYAIDEFTVNAYATYTVNWNTLTGKNGSLTITKHDKTLKRVEGFFTFTAVPFMEMGINYAITEGEFAITYH